MRAGEVAAETGVTVKALRYYESVGLLRPARRPNGYRDYSAEDARLTTEIQHLTALGLSLKETEPFLDCLRAGHDAGDACPESLATYQHKIDRLEQLIAHLSLTRDDLARHLHTAAARGFGAGTTSTEEPDTMAQLPYPPALPDDLPAPTDDGAADHLPGLTLPGLTLRASDGGDIRLAAVASGRWLLYIYPMTGRPGVDVPKGWDEIPGARGCSQEACGFRDNDAELRCAGVQQVFGLSTDSTDYQRELADRLHLPYAMLSDPDLALAGELGLPTFEAVGRRLYKRLTMVVRGSVIEHVFHPIFPPDTHAAQVLSWLRENPPD